MRADAADNRRKLIFAARDAIAAEGVGVSVREIADRAGVGVSTLYRHFPHKASLIDALSLYRWTTLHWLAEREVVDGGSLPSVARLMATLTRMVTIDDGFIREAGITVGRTPDGILPVKARFDDLFTLLWTRAAARAEVRPQLDPRDAIEMAGMIRDFRGDNGKLGIVLAGVTSERGQHALASLTLR